MKRPDPGLDIRPYLDGDASFTEVSVGIRAFMKENDAKLKAKPEEPDTSRNAARSQRKEARMSKGKSMKKEQKKPKKKR